MDGLTRLGETIEKAKLADWVENGRCSMCNVGHAPAEDGYHHHPTGNHLCGNAEPCLLCKGCLPPGEICAGCFRKNVYQIEC